MTFGAHGVMWMNTLRTPVRLSKIIFSQEHRNLWVALVCHCVTYVRSMGIDRKNVATCRRWLQRQKFWIAPFDAQWGTRIKTVELMTCFKREHMIHTLWRARIPAWPSSHSLSHKWCSQHPRCSIHHLCKCNLFHRSHSNSAHRSRNNSSHCSHSSHRSCSL